MKLGVSNYIKRPKGCKYHALVTDCTIGYGTEKLLLVLGIRKSDIKNKKMFYSHKDVDVLRIEVLKTVNGEIVETILQQTASRYGVPIQIIADGGSDLKKGIRLFYTDNPGTVYTYDVTHKCAIVLKHALADDLEWKEFHAACGECRRTVLNTDLFCCAPPKAKNKSRHLNLDRYIKWMNQILYISKHKKNRTSERFRKAFGWVEKYKDKLKIWEELMSLLYILKKEIKLNGFSAETPDAVRSHIERELNAISYSAEVIYSDIQEYISETIAPIPDGETWPGCSDIIESIFGRFKNYAKNTPFKGITQMVMAIPIFTTKITKDKIKRALEFKTVKNTIKWLRNNIGESMAFKRRNAFKIKRINKY